MSSWSLSDLVLSIFLVLRGLRLCEYLPRGDSFFMGSPLPLVLSSRRNSAILLSCSSRSDFTRRNSTVSASCGCSLSSASKGASCSQNHVSLWSVRGCGSGKGSERGSGSRGRRSFMEHSSRMASKMEECEPQGAVGTYMLSILSTHNKKTTLQRTYPTTSRPIKQERKQSITCGSFKTINFNNSSAENNPKRSALLSHSPMQPSIHRHPPPPPLCQYGSSRLSLQYQ